MEEDQDLQSPSSDSPSLPSPTWQSLQSSPTHPTSECLLVHNITPAQRTRLVNWVTDVMLKLDCMPNALFLAVKIADLFLKRCDLPQNRDDLHSIGLISMFLASKYMDRTPIRLKKLHQNVGFSLISTDVIKMREKMVLETICCELSVVTVLDALDVLLWDLDLTGVVAKTSECIAVLTLLDADISAIEATKLATVCVFTAVMVYDEDGLEWVVMASGVEKGELQGDVELVYSFLMDLQSHPEPISAMVNLEFEFGNDEEHPLFQFSDPILEAESLNLLTMKRARCPPPNSPQY